MRIGLVSDTHLPSLMRHLDELGPEAAEFLSTVDLILHAGDVSSPLVLDWLEQFAPVVVAEGNHDSFTDRRVDKVQILDIEGWRIGMVHNLTPETRPVPVLIDTHFPTPVDIIISGHTHLERLDYRDNVVQINSGSPILPHHKSPRLGTVGLLELTRSRLYAEIILLGHSDGLMNPGTPIKLEIEDGQVVSHLRGYSQDGLAAQNHHLRMERVNGWLTPPGHR